MHDDGMRPAVEARRLINGFRITQAIHVAVVLGLPDRLGDGPRTAADLATEAGCHPRALYRLLRALATVGVFEELDGERFGPTELSNALRTDAHEPIAGWAAWVGRPPFWGAWSSLLHSVRTGENAFASLHGQGVWEFRAERPDEQAAFDAAMTALSTSVVTSVLATYDFGRFTEVVDVGGGRGTFVAAILNRWPHLRGVVFDQPQVVAGAPELLAAAGVADRCRVEAGSFFDSVPAGADAYVLKSVVHDWPDDESIAILRRCRLGMALHATVLLVERVIPGPNEGADAAFSDLNMLVSPGGQERTADEFAALLSAAGFRLTRIVPCRSDFSVVEAVTDGE